MGERPEKLRQKYISYRVLKFCCFLATRDPNGLMQPQKSQQYRSMGLMMYVYICMVFEMS